MDGEGGGWTGRVVLGIGNEIMDAINCCIAALSQTGK